MRVCLVLVVCALAACGTEGDAAPSAPDTTDAPADTSVDVQAPVCPTGQVLDADGACMTVGIQGCDEMFINPETGLCEPTSEHCPPGQLPIFSGDDQGCRSIGIPGCHPDFIEPETGLCDPDLCDAGFIPVPTQGCVSLDPPGGCGEDTWGHVEERPGDVHVDMGYEGGDSDGTRDKPWTRISEGVGLVQPDQRLVLAAGVYDEGVAIETSISVVGRCASMVTIAGVIDGLAWPTVVEVRNVVDVGISDVTISGPATGVTVLDGARLALQRVSLTQNLGSGLWIGGGLMSRIGGPASVSATDVAISATAPLPDETWGVGIGVQDGTSLTLERVAVTDNHEAGLMAWDSGTTITATDVVVARTQRASDGTWGRGVTVQDGASLTLERSVITDNHSVGLHVVSGATALVTDGVIARTQPESDGTWGQGIYLQDEASLTLQRAVVSDNHTVGLYASSDAIASATDVAVLRTQPSGDGIHGWGAEVRSGASLTLLRAAVTDNHDVGIVADLAGTTVTATEVLIARTQPRPDGFFGRGIQVQSEATLMLDRSAVTDNHEGAVMFWAANGSVTDSLLMDTQELTGLSAGYADGLLVTSNPLFQATVTASGVVARGNARAGILFNDSEGTVAGCVSTDNVLGLVVQGDATPDLAEGNVITGNTRDLEPDGALAVPNEPMKVPELLEAD